MAKQKGIIKVQGTIGDITFSKSRFGYIIKEKTTLDKNRFNADPAFTRTRENASEFGKACKASKLLRTALFALLKNAKDSDLHTRLVTLLMKVIKADATSTRGFRNVMDGETEMLQGLEFNNNAQLTNTLYTAYTPTINRATGLLEIEIPSFIPADAIIAPAGATHYKMVAAGAEVNFEAGNFVSTTSNSTILPIDTLASAPLLLSNQVTANSTSPLFLIMGIQFFQQVNDTFYELRNGAFNALSIVSVSGI
ncbi:hypothetical protein ACFOWM_05580 [Ferruginibacter yonginensis]|uniref:Uncharacterized protein n=1 Tax=Ferruginibacter yonginensis TaxID=1310416 RepID=A0ABV8QQ73_9BACT